MTTTFPGFSLSAALERGACEECSSSRRIVWHYEGSICPWRIRLNEVPCQLGTCRKPTRRPDAFCSDGCAQVVASYKASR